MSITQEDIDALHQSPRSANDSDVTELCEKIAELQVSLAVSQREAADWKQELEAYKATENARISELQAEVTELRHAAGVSNQTIAALQADLAQARAEAKTNGDEAAAVRRLYGDAMVDIGELQAECERLRAELALKESCGVVKAVAWLHEQADKQAKINNECPEHVKCYPSWKLFERHARDLANRLFVEGFTAPLPDAQSLGQYTSGKPREMTADELAIVEEGKKYERLSGRGMHELRLDELPGYLMWVADNYADGPHMEGHYGAVRLSLLRAVSWVVAELERKTNDERVVASQLANVRAQKLPGGMQRDKMPGECAPIWPPEPEKLGGEHE